MASIHIKRGRKDRKFLLSNMKSTSFLQNQNGSSQHQRPKYNTNKQEPNSTSHFKIFYPMRYETRFNNELVENRSKKKDLGGDEMAASALGRNGDGLLSPFRRSSNRWWWGRCCRHFSSTARKPKLLLPPLDRCWRCQVAIKEFHSANGYHEGRWRRRRNYCCRLHLQIFKEKK